MDGPDPIYLRVRDELAREVRAERFEPDGRLPSERALAARFGIARMTLRQALLLMQDDGLIYREERRGWRVTPPRLRYDPTRHVNSYRLIRASGREADSVEVERDAVDADPVIAHLIGCAPGTALYRVRSVMLLDGRRVCYEENHLLPEAVPDFLERDYWEPITDYLVDTYGLRTEQTGFRARSIPLVGRLARSLGVAPGTPGWDIARIKSAGGRTVQVDRDFWVADALEFTVGRFPA